MKAHMGTAVFIYLSYSSILPAPPLRCSVTLTLKVCSAANEKDLAVFDLVKEAIYFIFMGVE